MTGLIKKDLLAYYRRSNSGLVSKIFVILMNLWLVLFLKNIYSLITVTLLLTPISMSSSAATLKEIDNSSDGLYTLILPYSWKDFVRGRFLTAFTDAAMEAALGLFMTLIHFFTNRLFPLSTYLLFWTAGVLIGLIFVSASTLAGFMAGMNASAMVYLFSILLTIGAFFASTVLKLDFSTLLSASPVLLWTMGILLSLGICALCYLFSFKAMQKSRRKC